MAATHQSLSLYAYEPSAVGAGIFCSIFCLSAASHCWQLLKNKTWHMIGFIVGGLLELIGYAARGASSIQEKDQWSTEPYLVQNIFLLVAPSFFAASIYSTLGRVIAVTDGDEYALVKKRWVTVFFVLADVFALSMQGAGGGLMAMGYNDPSRFRLGQKTIVGGLITQLVAYCLFFFSVATFYHRMDTLPPSKKQKHARIDYRRHLTMLFVVSALFMIRSLFRIIEYARGHHGYLHRHEAFTYVFDALPMALVMLYTAWRYPVFREMAKRRNRHLHLASVSEKASGAQEHDSVVNV